MNEGMNELEEQKSLFVLREANQV